MFAVLETDGVFSFVLSLARINSQAEKLSGFHSYYFNSEWQTKQSERKPANKLLPPDASLRAR